MTTQHIVDNLVKSKILHGKYILKEQHKNVINDMYEIMKALACDQRSVLDLNQAFHIYQQNDYIFDNKIKLLNNLSDGLNIGLFEVNKRNHAKFRIFNLSNLDLPWMLFADSNPTALNDFDKWIGLVCDYKPGRLTVKYTTDELVKMLTEYKLPVPTEIPSEYVPPMRLSNVKATKAGMFSLIRHRAFRNVARVKKRFSSKPQKSLSKTSTFTKQRINPEEYLDEHHINKLKSIGYGDIDPRKFTEKYGVKTWFTRGFNNEYKARKLYRELVAQQKATSVKAQVHSYFNTVAPRISYTKQTSG